MPYIRIKAYPKDQATKEKVVEAINKAASKRVQSDACIDSAEREQPRTKSKAFVDYWGCPPQAISISIEEVAPEDWVETVEKAEIEPHYRTGQRLWQADDASCH